MVITDLPDHLRRLEIPGKTAFLEGNGELTKIEARSRDASAEIYLHGAQVTEFRKKGQPPILFTSTFSRFKQGQPIRGGIPIIFPWFGSREGEPMHGFARLEDWSLHEATATPEGGVHLRFHLPGSAESGIWPSCTANYLVTLTDSLALELIITNLAPDAEFVFETCLHSYFAVGDINQVTLSGLKGLRYFDKADNFTLKTDSEERLRITSEVDRHYLDTPDPVEILDPVLGRIIRVTKRGSQSTVVWNPGAAKIQQIPDLGSDEYQRMICVESGNVGKNKVALAPGQSASLAVQIHSEPLP